MTAIWASLAGSDTALWIGFLILVVGLVIVDLRSGGHEAMSPRRALGWSLFYIALSAAFGLVVWRVRGGDAAVQFYTGYLLEKALSVDNLFVFLLIFARFQVPAAERHRVLTWGVLGAVGLRAVMIFAGVELIHTYHAVIYAFGALLVWTGVRTLVQREHDEEPGEGRLVRAVRRVLPLAPRYDGGRFFTHDHGRRVGTLLLLVLVVVELSDVLFAVDSIPAIFAVTDDPFIVFTSNILAVLGLRALFFAVGDLLSRLRYLRHGLGVVLISIGGKMLLSGWFQVPPLWSLAGTLAVLAVTVALSLARPAARREAT